MQTERAPQHSSQEIQVTKLVPEQAGAAMQRALIDLLRALLIPITITEHKDPRDRTDYYTYQVGEVSEQQPYGIAMGATPVFLDAMRFSLEAVMRQAAQNSSESHEHV